MKIFGAISNISAASSQKAAGEINGPTSIKMASTSGIIIMSGVAASATQ